MAERDVQHAVLKRWGCHKRIRLARMNTGVGWFANGKPARQKDPGAYPVKFGVVGMADLVGIIAPTGRALFIELKRPGGRQSKEQIAMQRMVTLYGGLYILADCVADVDAVLIPLVGAP